MFQSHAGSIEAQLAGHVDFYSLSRFNPTLVRLRPVRGEIPSSPTLGFNPTLVRLRQGPAPPHGPRGPFQSHAGSIEAWNPVEAVAVALELFQSHAGSIEAIGQCPSAPHVGRVSIPRWFD